jgi:hypothetical protein
LPLGPIADLASIIPWGRTPGSITGINLIGETLDRIKIQYGSFGLGVGSMLTEKNFPIF